MMVANDHAVNREFTARLFSLGVAREWCRKFVTLLFVGTISNYVGELARSHLGLPDGCIVAAGVQSRRVLAQQILPRTLALLNPFWRDLKSGISVKSYDAVAAGIPLVTSVHGLRGLKSCGAPKLALGAKEADDESQYIDFVERLLFNPDNYALLAEAVLQLRNNCTTEQETAFPVASLAALVRAGPAFIRTDPKALCIA